MRWRLRRLAGSPDGEAAFVSGTFDDARFDSPLDLALSADEASLYVADAGNNRIRQVQLDDDYIGDGVLLNAIPRWDAAGTLSGRPRNLSIGKSGTDDVLRITADNSVSANPGVLFEWNFSTGIQSSALSTAGNLGAIAHDPGGSTATVKIHINETGTGWGTLALSGASRGTITEPPVIPSPPYCDPPTNSIPVQVMRVRDLASSEDSGVARVGSVVVAFRWLPTGAGVVAFDPWNEIAFPSPYTTCAAPTNPTDISVACTGAIATPRPPWSATRGPDDPDSGLPTVIGAPWRSPNGILLRAVLDTAGSALQVDYNLVTGFADLPVMGVAYSPARETYYLSTADTWGDPGTAVPANQILALEWVPDLPIYSGGSGRMPIGGLTGPT
jgi:hypothetical protein